MDGIEKAHLEGIEMATYCFEGPATMPSELAMEDAGASSPFFQEFALLTALEVPRE